MTAAGLTPEERAREIVREWDDVPRDAFSNAHRPLIVAIATAIRAAVEAEQEARPDLKAIMQALDEREMFLNPDTLDRAADEIDCGLCENAWTDWDTNASGCRVSERGDYCPNDVAATLRALAEVSRELSRPHPRRR